MKSLIIFLRRFRRSTHRIEEERYTGSGFFWQTLCSINDFLFDRAHTSKIISNLLRQQDWFIQVASKRCSLIPRVFVETGTYRGDTTNIVSKYFPIVHTIELSRKWHERSLARFKHHTNVFCHLGDSATILQKLLPTIDEPILFFLDAHYSGGTTAFGEEEVPLLRELEIIGKRKYRDLIIVDDMKLMGKAGVTGEETSVIYPSMKFDWRGITLSKIKEALRWDKVVCEQIGDRFVISHF